MLLFMLLLLALLLLVIALLGNVDVGKLNPLLDAGVIFIWLLLNIGENAVEYGFNGRVGVEVDDNNDCNAMFGGFAPGVLMEPVVGLKLNELNDCSIERFGSTWFIELK